MVVMV
jgi:hypothetical protein